MTRIITKNGSVTIGSFADGYPTQTTWGSSIPVVDAGQPLATYSPHPTDPLTLWKTQPSLRKVVEFAARQVGSIPWHAYKRVDDTDRQRQHSSPAERTLAHPAKFRSGYRFWETLVIDALLYDVYAAVLADGRLVRIPPKLLHIKSDWLGRATQILLRTPAGRDDIDLTDAPLLIDWGWHPTAAGGVSPMHTLAGILAESRRAVEWRDRQWQSSPKINGILTHPGSFKQDKRERFLNTWRQWRDAGGPAGTPILEDGMDYKVLEGFTPEQAKDIEGRQLTDAEVASAFHIPPELVGARPGNFSNMEAFRQMLFGPTLGPLIESFEQAVNNQLVAHLDPTPGLYVEANREAKLAGSFMEQARVMQTMTGGPVMTRAEGRARLNLPYIDGTDELIVPLNVTEGGLASPTDTGEQNVKTAIDSHAKKAIEAALRKASSPDNGGDDRDTSPLAAAIQETLAEQQKQVLDDGGIGDQVDFHNTWDAPLAERLHPELAVVAAAAAAAVLAEHNPDRDGWDDAVMDGYLAAVAATSARKINDGVVKAVHAAEIDPRDEEAPPKDTRIKDAFWTLGTVTALVWAGTLATETSGFAGNDAAKKSGLTHKTWLVTSGNPRPSHARLHGEKVPVGETFSNGAKWPADQWLHVDEIAGCTCVIEFSTE